jgi:hypothetical protein
MTIIVYETTVQHCSLVVYVLLPAANFLMSRCPALKRRCAMQTHRLMGEIREVRLCHDSHTDFHELYFCYRRIDIVDTQAQDKMEIA